MNIFKSSLLFVLMVSFQGLMQAQEWVSYQSQQQINDLVDTGDELLMATDAGLVVMNKTTLEKTIFNKSNSNLSNNHIQSITQAPDGNTYIGTYDVIMRLFDGSDFQDAIIPESDEYDQYTELYDFEVAPNGDIWVATSDGVFHKVGQDWLHYDEDEFGPDFFEAWDIEINNNGEVFVGANNVHKYANNEWSNISATTQLQGYLDAELFFTESGDLFFAGDLDRIGHFDGNEWTEYENGGLNGSEIKGFAEDTNGNIYFHTLYDGIFKLENNTWTPQVDSQTEAFNNNTSFFYIDEQNNRWLNYNIYLSVSNNSDIQSTSISPTTIEYDNVGNLHNGLNGNMYIMMYTSTNNVAVVSPDGTWSYLPLPSDFSLWPVIGDMLVLAENDIWLAASEGLYHYDGNIWTLKISEGFSSLTVDTEGKIYAKTNDKIFIIEDEIITDYNVNNSPLSSLIISGLGIDPNNNLWIASFDWDGEAAIQKVATDGTWTTYSKIDFPAINKPSGDFHFDNNGDVWIPSDQFGAIKFDGTDWTNPVAENATSLENTSVYSIASNAEGKLFFAHQYGVSTFLDGEWDNLIIDDVPYVNSSHDSDIEFDDNGTLWWASSRYGVFSYTEEMTSSTFTTDQQETNLTIFPNPAHDYCTLDFTTTENSKVEISIFNNLGQQVSRMNLNQLPAGSFQETIDITKLYSGIYTLRLQVNDKAISKKIIVH